MRTRGVEALWQAVLIQAARDLLNKTGPRAGLENYQVLQWLGTRDFRFVCTNAGFDPGMIEAGLRRAHATGVPFPKVQLSSRGIDA